MEGGNVQGPARRPRRRAEHYRQEGHEEGAGDFTWPNRAPVDVEGMVRDAFGHVDDIHNNVVNENNQVLEDGMNLEGDDDFDGVNVENLLRDAREKIFEGNSLNRLQCGIVLFSLCSLYSVPNTFLDALLTWIAGDLLPTSNCFPRTSYEIKTMIMKWGLQHRQVHTCQKVTFSMRGRTKTYRSVQHAGIHVTFLVLIKYHTG